MKNKFILDACCGNRMFWVNKKHPNCVFLDKRKEVNPDIVGDFRDLKFPNNSFKLVIWDVPHIIQEYNENSIIINSYGNLEPKTWKEDLKKGFDECMRVLEDYGILEFKWNSRDWDKRTQINNIIKIFGKEPLIKNMIKKEASYKRNNSKTYWLCFMKIPKQIKEKKE